MRIRDQLDLSEHPFLERAAADLRRTIAKHEQNIAALAADYEKEISEYRLSLEHYQKDLAEVEAAITILRVKS